MKHCLGCGHFFNALTQGELAGLSLYYQEEYAPSNLGVADKIGDRPGSDGALTIERYEGLFDAISPHIDVEQSVLDVGCALGGFLDYIGHKGFRNVAGVDMTKTYVDQARLTKPYPIKIGNAESLPFDDESFHVVVMEQVMEHLYHPGKAFLEARRVLKPQGILSIGVPDAARYGDCHFFDYYWILLREHIQHFDIAHLALLGQRFGFELLEYRETVHAIMTEQMRMPNLYAIFRRTEKTGSTIETSLDKTRLGEKMKAYLVQEKAHQIVRRKQIEALRQSRRPIYAWGIGREFLYLYESVGLKRCHIAGLIDANPHKQKNAFVDHRPIQKAESLLPAAPFDCVLMITALAHTAAITEAAKVLGFRGEILDISQRRRDD
jgi:SAM-dependent methyltransferase